MESSVFRVQGYLDQFFKKDMSAIPVALGPYSSRRHIHPANSLLCPENTRVYPGHDYNGRLSSTIGEEKRWNERPNLSNPFAMAATTTDDTLVTYHRLNPQREKTRKPRQWLISPETVRREHVDASRVPGQVPVTKTGPGTRPSMITIPVQVRTKRMFDRRSFLSAISQCGQRGSTFV